MELDLVNKSSRFFRSLVFLLILFWLPLSFGASIKKVTRGKAVIKGLKGEFRKGDPVSVYSSSGDLKAKGRIVKAAGKKYYMVRSQGNLKRGYRVRLSNNVTSSKKGSQILVKEIFSTNKNTVGGSLYGGLAGRGIGLGVDAFWGPLEKGLKYRASFSFWQVKSESGEKVVEIQNRRSRALEFSLGSSYGIKLSPFVFSPGLRLGYALQNFRSEFEDVIVDSELTEFSGGGFFVAPHLLVQYLWNKKMRFGVDIRYTYPFFKLVEGPAININDYANFSILALLTLDL